MDPLEKLNLELDTSVRIAFELQALGHETYFGEVKDLFWLSGKVPATHAQPFAFSKDVRSVKAGPSQSFPLDAFSAIHMRKDPPFDVSYITATWFLDAVSTLVVNAPHALRTFNEKMATLRFPEVCKPTFVGCQAQDLLEFIQDQCHGNAILKPLYQYGGRGIFRVNLEESNEHDARELLKKATERETQALLAQPFDDRIQQGEARAFALDGRALAWCLKIPRKGEFLANTRAGASLHPFTPTHSLESKIEKLSQKLADQGIFIVGFDIIGEDVTEINITSPRLLAAPGDTYNYYLDIAKWFEKKI